MAEKVDSPYQDVCVYSSVLCGPLKGTLSAVVITRTGDVFGSGVNSLVTSGFYTDEYPMMEGCGEVLKDWVKIDQLCGLGIKKIDVSWGFGIALTSSTLLTWGRGFPTYLCGLSPVVIFQKYQHNTKCQICPQRNHMYKEFGERGTSLSYCDVAQRFPRTYSPDSPPPHGILTKSFVRYSGYLLRCYECGRICSRKEVNSINLYYCVSCQRFLEGDAIDGLFNNTQAKHHGFSFDTHDLNHNGFLNMTVFYTTLDDTLTFNGDLHRLGTQNLSSNANINVENSKDGVAQIFGFCLLIAADSIQLWAFINNQWYSSFSRQAPSDERLKAVNGDYVLAESGNLFSWYPTHLLRMATPAPIIKMCPGSSKTMYLMADDSVWVRNNCETQFHRFTQNAVFSNIANARRNNTFFVEANGKSAQICLDDDTDLDQIELSFCNSDCTTLLLNSVCQQPVPAPTDQIQPSVAALNARQTSFPRLHAFLSGLYGKPLFQDLTIQLSDGDFPAHRVVLCTTSNFLRKKLISYPATRILDMKCFDAQTFKCLMKYYYEQEPDDMDLDRLLDLLLLANSFEENHITDDVEGKINGKLNASNVLHVLDISKKNGFETLIGKCERFMKLDQSFKEHLLSLALQNPGALTHQTYHN